MNGSERITVFYLSPTSFPGLFSAVKSPGNEVNLSQNIIDVLIKRDQQLLNDPLNWRKEWWFANNIEKETDNNGVIYKCWITNKGGK